MAQIPMVALAAVMMIAALKTMDWHSVRPTTFKRMPVPETMVMVTTVAVTVVTGNLAIGIAVGVVLAMILFARRVAHVIRAERTLQPGRPGRSVTASTARCSSARATISSSVSLTARIPSAS